MGNNLDVSIRGKTGPLRESLAQAKSDVNKFKSSVEKGGGFGQIKEIAQAVLGFSALKEVIDYGDKIADLSQRFGVSAVALQQWGNVAEENGSSLEGLAIGLNKLTIAQEKAVAGDKDLVADFAKLGVSLDDLKSDDPSELLRKIGASSMSAGEMVKILGKGALELRPALAAVADGSAELGSAMDENLIGKLGEASDTLKRFKQTALVAGGEALGFLMKWGEAAGIGVGKLINTLTVGSEEARRIAEQQVKDWEEQWNGAAQNIKPRQFPEPEVKDDDKERKKTEDRIKKLKDEAFEIRGKALYDEMSAAEKIDSIKEQIAAKEKERASASEERSAEIEKETSELYLQLAAVSKLKNAEEQRAMDKKVDRKLMTPAERSAADREEARRARTERAIRRNEANAEEAKRENAHSLKPREKPDFVGPPAPDIQGPTRNRDPKLDRSADVKTAVDKVYDLLDNRLKFPKLGGAS